MRLFLCPSEFFLDCGELWASQEIAAGTKKTKRIHFRQILMKNVTSGTSFYPWTGEVISLPTEELCSKELQVSDPRLQYAVMDNGMGSNFVKYMTPCDFINQSNILAHCGSLGQ